MFNGVTVFAHAPGLERTHKFERNDDTNGVTDDVHARGPRKEPVKIRVHGWNSRWKEKKRGEEREREKDREKRGKGEETKRKRMERGNDEEEGGADECDGRRTRTMVEEEKERRKQATP